MKKKYKILSVLTAAAVASTVTLAGCSLVSANAQADMKQVIAEVNIGNSDNLEKIDSGLKEYAGAIESSTSIYKSDLVAYFLSAGASLVQGGSTYGEAFQTLAESLINSEILIQYATIATLRDMVESGKQSSASAAVSWFTGMEEAERYEALLDYQAEVDDNEGEDDVDYVMLVEYSLKSSVNATIDSYEEAILDSDSEDGTSSATLPGGVDTEVEYYYPVKDGALDYDIYTGYSKNSFKESGAYADDALEGTTSLTRRRAYNEFIQMLDANYLITDEDDITDVWTLSYVQDEYVTLLRRQVLSNFYELYEGSLEDSIDAEYVSERYNEILSQQTAEYDASASSFETAMGSFSDSSFILYAPETKGSENKFGFVYNILLPFSSSQSSVLATYSTLFENDAIDQNGYYRMRNNLLNAVRGTDQRASWFNGGVDYSFDASANDIEYYDGGVDTRDTLFFEDNLLDTENERYEKLEKYLGLYSYNGIAVKNEDDSYTLLPDYVSIDDLLVEFEGYLNFALGGDKVDWAYWANGKAVENSSDAGTNADYYDVTDFYTVEGDTKSDIDYSKFIYAAGKVDLGNFTAASLMDEDSDYYRAMSAVNELQYAYTTDTSVLSQYIGYSVGAYSTSYIKEFEYAAQQAVREGAGSFVVCAGDYGWHLMYVTFSFDAGDVYGNVDFVANMDKDGTFEYEFYQALKSSEMTSASTTLQSNLLQQLYQEDKSVKIYEDRFSDLTSITQSATSSTDGSTSGSSSSGSTSSNA